MIGENLYKIPLSYQLYFSIIFLSGVYTVYEYLTVYSVHSYVFVFLTINSYYTFGEYIIHRFFFHLLFEKIHQKHHDDPKRYYRLFIPMNVTLINEVFLILISYLFFYNHFLAIMSSAHFSYLLFEMAHYCAHYPVTSLFSIFIPKRLISFHYMHHIDNNYNYGFTTPFWDILCNTTSLSFNLFHYPFSILPISVISFLDMEEIVVLGNVVYLYPSYICYKNGWESLAIFYTSVGVASTVYHSYNCLTTKIIDYTLAVTYLFVSLYMFLYLNLIREFEPYVWFTTSIITFFYDKTHLTHIIWHFLTGVGVGRMLSLKI